MKKFLTCLLIILAAIPLSACMQRGASQADEVAGTATARAMIERIPADVPVMAGAYQLSVSSSGDNISYRVAGIFEDVVLFYQEQTLAAGWEQLGGEQIMMRSITMQRSKPDRNMSILISEVQGSGEVLVNLMFARR